MHLLIDIKLLFTLQRLKSCSKHENVILFAITEAQAYVDLLQSNGTQCPVDKDVDTYTMQLPEWYNEELFKK